jgi:serine/threonine-protein kinase
MREGIAARIATLAPWVVGFALSVPRAAHGQGPPTAGNKVAAEALFEDARTLVSAGKYAEACPKFADSQRLDPSPSTLLNLASCWEKLGRTATAWATYREAESAASAAHRPEYVTAAQRHAEALAPRLARLILSVQQPVAGLQLTEDGAAVAASEWGTAIPIDPGVHTLEATAPGYKPWSGKVEVEREGAQMTVPVPGLEALPPEAPPAPPSLPVSVPAEAPPPPPAASAPPAGGGQRVMAAVVGGAGILGLGVSGVLALVANSEKNDSLKYCPGNPNVCTQTGVDKRDDALRLGDGATVALAIGAAALAGGVVLWVTAPSGRATVGVVPSLGGAIVRGRF